MSTVADTIKEATKKHLAGGGLLFAQCVSAVGWIGGTVPDVEGVTELSMADVAGSGIAVGAALSGRRPIYVIRYQGFMWYNAASLLNYAAKSKEMWGVPCPIFVRAITNEVGGPVAGGAHHGMVMRMPGIKVFAPMTPNEWTEAWEWFLSHDEPVYCSEHRSSFANDYETPNLTRVESKVTLFAISGARINAMEAFMKVECDLFHVTELKPFEVTPAMIHSLKYSRRGLVVDCDYDLAAKGIAHELMMKSGVPVDVLALEDRTAGFSPDTTNDGPSVSAIVARLQQEVS